MEGGKTRKLLIWDPCRPVGQIVGERKPGGFFRLLEGEAGPWGQGGAGSNAVTQEPLSPQTYGPPSTTTRPPSADQRGPCGWQADQGHSLMRVPLESTLKKGKTRSPKKAAEKVCTWARVSAL